MNFMNCTTCRALVQRNEIGICLGCQRGFLGNPQEDAYVPDEPEKSVDELEKRKLEIEKELTNANEKPSTKSVPTRKQTKNGKAVGKRNSKRKKATKKGKEKEKIKD